MKHVDFFGRAGSDHNVIAIIGLEHAENIQENLLKSGRTVLVLLQK